MSENRIKVNTHTDWPFEGMPSHLAGNVSFKDIPIGCPFLQSYEKLGTRMPCIGSQLFMKISTEDVVSFCNIRNGHSKPYKYVGHNPAEYTDSLGLAPWSFIDTDFIGVKFPTTWQGWLNRWAATEIDTTIIWGQHTPCNTAGD